MANAALSQDGELHIAQMTSPPETLDPFEVYGTESQSFFRQIFDTLISRDEEGQLKPAIAERWEYRGNEIWRLHIRPGVVFQDGSPLTVRDVKFSLDRLLGPESVEARRRDFSFIRRVEISDDRSVDIHTRGPISTLPARLAQFSMVLPERRLREKGEAPFFRAPIGAGPFRLVRMDRKMAVFERHEGYYQGKPAPPRLYFHFVEDSRERLRMLLKGDLDIVPNVLPAFTRQIAEAPAVSVVKKPAQQFTYVVFDTLTPGPVADLRVRRALAHWTDVVSLIRYVAHGNGRRIATFVMPEEFGFHPGLQPYPFDPDLARRFMDAAGYKEGFVLSALASDEIEPLARAVIQQWEYLGVRTRLTVLPRAEAIQRWTKSRAYQAYLFAPTNLLLDASYHLKSKLDPTHPVNRFHHPEATRLVQEMNRVADPDRRREVLYRLQEIAYEYLPALALYQVVNIYGVSDRLKGFQAYPDTILRLYQVRMVGLERPRENPAGYGAR